MKRFLIIATGFVAAVFIAIWLLLTVVIDEQRLKTEITKIVEQQTNGSLTIDGTLQLHIFPKLQLELGQLSYQLAGDEKPLAALDSLRLGVAVMPLLSGSVEIEEASLAGLKLALVLDPQGVGNWQKVMAVSDTVPANSTEDAATATNDAAAGEEPSSMAINVNIIDITDTDILYSDQQAGSETALSGFYLKASGVNLQGNSFPIETGLALSVSAPQLDTQLKLAANLAVTNNNNVSISDGKITVNADGDALAGQQVEATFTLKDVAADIAAETVSIQFWQLILNGIDASGDLRAAQWSQNLQLDSQLQIAAFDAAKLAKQLGQTLPPMAAEDALTNIAFSSALAVRGDQIKVDNIVLTLDKSKLTGLATVNHKRSGRIAANLVLDQFDLDRYMPPASQEQAVADEPQQPKAGANASSANSAQQPLFPIEDLRALDIDFRFALNKLMASGLVMSDATLQLTAYQGLLKLNALKAKAYDGSINANASLNVTTDTPKLSLKNTVVGVKINPILIALADTDWIYGNANMAINISSRGNTTSALEKQAKGTVNFRLRDGRAEGFNLEKNVCQAISLINGDDLSGQWSEHTTLKDIVGKVRIDGQKITNTKLSGGLTNMMLKGDGVVNLANESVDYGLGLKIAGSDEGKGVDSCRVNERYRDIYWPMRCTGKLTDDPASMCGIDEKQMGNIITDLATKEVKRKAEGAVNDALNKWLKR
jgi:AsmA protein